MLLLVTLFCLTFAVYGLRLLQVAALQVSPALGISMVWPYLALPLSGVLMTVAAVVLITSELRAEASKDDSAP